MKPDKGRDPSIARRAAALYERLVDASAAERSLRLEALGHEDPALREHVERMLVHAAALDPSLGLQPAALPGVLPIDGDAAINGGADADSLIGACFDGFEILEHLASGGMADVYRARQASPSREVAVKVFRLGPGQHGHEHMAGRIEREADLLASIDHPNVAPVYAGGSTPPAHGGRAFIAMKLIDGETIDRASSGVSIEQRLRWIIGVARALHAAHERGILHRDVKPGNIMVDRSGRPFLLDFSLGKASAGRSSRGQTQAGIVMGTQEWMSPEQFNGQSTIASDLYALGLVLRAILGQASARDPSPIPSAIRRAVEHATQREPTLRPESAAAWADELERSLHRPRRRRRLGVMITCGVALALTLVAIARWLGPSRGGVQPDRLWHGIVTDLAPIIDPENTAGLIALAADRWTGPLSRLGEEAEAHIARAQRATDAGDHDEAARAWAAALVQRERLYGASDPSTLRTALDLAQSLARDDRPEQAVHVLEGATGMLSGGEDPAGLVHRASWALGLALLAEGRWTTGVANLAAGYEGMLASGLDREARDIARDAARAYEAAGSFERASEWWSRASTPPEQGTSGPG